MNEDYYTIETCAVEKIKIKRSLFIAHAGPAITADAAEEFIARDRKEFHDATHHCYAYRIDRDLFRFSDDGEPSGTAGQPILSMLDKSRLFRAVVVVTRYFGGIKLGTGGLLRAYAEAAETVLSKMPRIKVIPVEHLKVLYPYPFTNQFNKIVHKFNVKISHSDFQEEVRADLEIPVKHLAEFQAALLQAGAGKIKILV